MRTCRTVSWWAASFPLVLLVLGHPVAAQQPCTDWSIADVIGIPPSSASALGTRGSRAPSLAHSPEGFFAFMPQGWFGQTTFMSADGDVWANRGEAPLIDRVQWGLGRFVGGTVSSLVAFVADSPDGLSWGFAQTPIAAEPGASVPASWTGKEFFLVAEDTQGDAFVFSDQTPFQTTSLPSTGLDYVAASGNAFVVAGRSGLAVGPTLHRLEEVQLPVPTEIRDVVWGAGTFAAVGATTDASDRSVILTSQDGSSWRVAADWAGERPGDILFTGTTFVALGQGTRLTTSSDGLTWTLQRLQITNLPPAVTQVRLGPGAWDGRNLVTAARTDAGTFFVRTRCDSLGPTLVLPSAAHLDGIGGSHWRTDLVLHNPDWRETQVRIELLERDRANPDPQFRFVVLPGGSSLRVEDVVGRSFGVSGAATLRITPTATTITASARTYNDSGSGSYGQLIEGIAETDAIPAGRTARLIGLAESGRDDTGFRTNLGLVSVSGEPMEVEVELRNADGTTLGTLAVELAPWESVQLDRVFASLTPNPVEAGLALVRTATPTGRFFAYASVIDNRTHDPQYVPAR